MFGLAILVSRVGVYKIVLVHYLDGYWEAVVANDAWVLRGYGDVAVLNSFDDSTSYELYQLQQAVS